MLISNYIHKLKTVNLSEISLNANEMPFDKLRPDDWLARDVWYPILELVAEPRQL